MAFTTILSAEDLKALFAADAQPLLLDCSFELTQPGKGREAYLAGHIPGARYVHLDDDLAATPSGTNGRHPLPDADTLAQRLRVLGLSQGQQVVAYDASGGAWAARAWWLLRWLGHEAVAVLDGGLPAWVEADGPLETGDAGLSVVGDFTRRAPLVGGTVGADDVLANIQNASAQVLDARDPSRFRGDPNPIDPVAGHIPAAKNRFFRDNLDASGRFRPAGDLRDAFTALIGDTPAILQCGSGVTACHNALAMEIAGLPGAKLYPGSWSEWIADPARPVATGEV